MWDSQLSVWGLRLLRAHSYRRPLAPRCEYWCGPSLQIHTVFVVTRARRKLLYRSCLADSRDTSMAPHSLAVSLSQTASQPASQSHRRCLPGGPEVHPAPAPRHEWTCSVAQSCETYLQRIQISKSIKHVFMIDTNYNVQKVCYHYWRNIM